MFLGEGTFQKTIWMFFFQIFLFPHLFGERIHSDSYFSNGLAETTQLAIFQAPFFFPRKPRVTQVRNPVKPPSSLLSLRPADLNASLDQSPEVEEIRTLKQQTKSHLGKRKIIFKMPFFGDILVSWRVPTWSLTAPPLKSYRDPIGSRLPTIIFQGRAVKLRRSNTFGIYLADHPSIPHAGCQSPPGSHL